MPQPLLAEVERNASITQFSMCRAEALRKRTPLVPVPGLPLMRRLRRVTMSVAAALTVTPAVPEARMLASKPQTSMVIELVMYTVPNPPGSRTEMIPPAAVLEIAPAEVLHGAVRLHGLTSSPTPDTQVRVWALAPALASNNPAPSRSVRRPTFFA